MTEDQADIFTHALPDIRESAVEIYDDYLTNRSVSWKPGQIPSGTFAKLAGTSTITSRMPLPLGD
jgi:hypothetical protein